MALKKGYCTNCNKHDETRRIFDVNSDAKFCYCPHCGKKYRTKHAISTYENVIQKYIRRSYFYLRNVGDANKAYSMFAYVLELEPSNKTAKLGRLLSLAYLSSLRRNRCREVSELLQMSANDFHGSNIKREYVSFLVLLNHFTISYVESLKKKLTFRSYFYDIDCLKLYFKHIYDTLALKRLIAAELSMCDENQQVTRVNESMKVMEDEFNKSFYDVNGQEHRLVNFAKSGDPLVVNGRNRVDTTKILRYRMATLDPTNKKKKRLLSDVVFTRTYIRVFETHRLSFPVMLVLATLALITLVVYLCLYRFNWSLVLLVFAITLGVGAITFLMLRIFFGSILRKTRL